MKLKVRKFFRDAKKIYADDAEKIKKGYEAGLFARQNIKKGEVVFTVQGVETVSFVPRNSHEALHWFPHSLGIRPYTWINPSNNEPLRYINHSCNPNVGIKNSIKIVALRDIEKDEHITIDYSITEIDPRFGMKCICGEKICRKTIKAIDSIPEKQFKKYKGYVPQGFLRYRQYGLPKPEAYEVKYPRGKHRSVAVRRSLRVGKYLVGYRFK
jgi:uncharacterized protein